MSLTSFISSRDEVDGFRDYLRQYSPEGLVDFQIWLTANGYLKEFARYRVLHDNDLENFVKWNAKCAKAMIDRFFEDSQPDLHHAYEFCKKFSTVATAEMIKTEMESIRNMVQSRLERKYLTRFTGGTNRLLFISENHNNTEYQSTTTECNTCSEDTKSCHTDWSAIDSKKDKKRYRRRQKNIKRSHLGRNRSAGPKNSDFIPPSLPKMPNEADLATKNPKGFAKLVVEKLEKVLEMRENDSILDDHLERVMKTPNTRSSLLALPSRTLRNLKQRTKLTFSSFRSSDSEKKHVQKREPQPLTKSTSGPAILGTFPTPEPENVTLQTLLSSDSGLSSTRIESESEMAESEILEIDGLKQRLIEETDGSLSTNLLYEYDEEKYIVKCPGRSPTLASFRGRIHLRGMFRFFFKNEEAIWVEITDLTEPVPVLGDTVHAKVIAT